MAEKWYCNTCMAQFPRPADTRELDDGLSVTVALECPYCHSRHIEEMDRCPTCEGGWRRMSDRVCIKCHLRNVSAIKMFARQFSPAALADMDDILEGSGLEMFV